MFATRLARPHSLACLMSLSITGGMAYSVMGSPSAACASKPSVRVASYNLLSSNYSDPREMKKCDPADLVWSTRLQRLQDKLSTEIKQDAVIGIQELSQTWASGLLPFFFREGYHVLTAHYGGKHSGYMGVAMAWPGKTYEALETNVEKISDLGAWPTRPKNSTLSWIMSIPSRIVSLFVRSKEPYDPWMTAKGRSNQLAMVRLKDRATGATFWVGSYHMPCLFGTPEKRQTMVMHAYLALKALQDKAARTGDPYVLLGDFNFQPGQAPYKLITEGRLDKLHEDFPQLPSYATDDIKAAWALEDLKPMRSAYATVNGREPECTTNAWMHHLDSKTSEESVKTFTETLDYIFCSEHWQPVSVRPLPSRDELATIPSFPTASEPSDHMMIGARIAL